MTANQDGLNAPTLSPRRFADFSDDQLIRLIEGFHAAHLADLAEALRLSRMVEARHGAEGAFPAGLTEHLQTMLDEVGAHQGREETALFPLILSGRDDLLKLPISALGVEHSEAQRSLERLVRITRDYTPPPNACRSWRTLYELCRKFDGEFREHLQLEERVLFPRFS